MDYTYVQVFCITMSNQEDPVFTLHKKLSGVYNLVNVFKLGTLNLEEIGDTLKTM